MSSFEMQRRELDEKVRSVHQKLTTERTMLDKAQQMRNAHMGNARARSLVEGQIREAQRNVTFFEETLKQLVEKRRRLAERDLPLTPSSVGDAADSDAEGGPGITRDVTVSRGKQISNFDLIREDAPHTPAKISLMLHQLDYKLTRERHYKEGIEKMAMLYSADGDKRSRGETQAKKAESDGKIAILRAALKRYQNLNVAPAAEDVAAADERAKADGLRKPVSGTLQITIKSARDLNHQLVSSTIFSSRSKGTPALETIVLVKVGEETSPARTRPSRSAGHDSWNEMFEIPVDKVNEVEIAIHERPAGSSGTGQPIGLLWIKISDLVEELRRKKVEAEGRALLERMNQQGGAMPGSRPHGDVPPGAPASAPYGSQGDGVNALAGVRGEQAEGVDGWFAVQPAGALALRLNFIKQNVRKRPLDASPLGLGRQGALRKRKEEVHEMNGHAFVQRQFITNVIKCAYCEEFVLDGRVYRCEDCRYTCHRTCYNKVVTKCVSKSDNAGERDEEKINHRIPHRFVGITSLTPNWCCHCGEIMNPLSKKARKCSECPVTCHADCAHLVPDFCGMSMVTANELLRQMQAIGATRASNGGRRPTSQPPRPLPASTSFSHVQQADDRPLKTPPTGAPVLSDIEHRTASLDLGREQPPPPPPREASYGSPVLPSTPSGTYVGANQPPLGSAATGYDAVPPSPSKAFGAVPAQGPYPVPPSGARPLPQQPAAGPGGRPYASAPQQQPPYAPPAPTATQPSPYAPPSAGVAPPAQPVVPAVQAQSKRKIGLDAFNFLAVLGKGNFGKVMLAEEKRSSQLYAIKVLKKEFIIENDEVESTKSEKRVFLAAARERHPFLLGLHSCFQTETRVYFVMEYVSGGDLMLHIQRQQFTPRQARFYACEVLCALQYFHQNGIVYRDLKLDNILLTLDGHVKVADYGLCKENMFYGATTSTFCGTPEFMAPEILLEQRYGRAVDWWAFGVLLYEMLLGQSPFRGDDEDEIFDAILEDEPLYPIHMPRDSVSILQKLLMRDPKKRLGSGEEDAEEIKRHAYFKDVNWDDVIHKRIPTPFRPSINSATDTSNFDREFTSEAPTLTPVHSQLSQADQAEFAGFSWTAPWAD